MAPLLAPHGSNVSIAAVNAPGAGRALGHRCRPFARSARGSSATACESGALSMTHAFHSPLIEPALEAFGAEAARIEHREPRIAVVSNVTGGLAGAGESTAAYWARHVRSRCDSPRASAALHAEGVDVFLEIGPHPALLPLGPAVRARRGDVAAVAAAGRGRLDLRAADPGRALRPGRRRRLGGVRARPPAAARGAADLSVPARAVLGRRRRARRPGARATSVEAVWDASMTAGRRQMEQGPLDLAAATYPAKWASLATLSPAYAAAALVSWAASRRRASATRSAALAERWSLPAARRHLLSRWLARLVAAGLLCARARSS